LNDTILPFAFDLYGQDYAASPLKAPEVLGLFAELALKGTQSFLSHISIFMERIFLPTREVLEHYADDRDFCVELNRLLSSLAFNCTFLTTLPEEQVLAVMDCFQWSCEHPQPCVSEQGIRTMTDFLCQVEAKLQNPVVTEFQKFFGPQLLVLTFKLLTDSVHKFAVMPLIGLARRLMMMQPVVSKIRDLVDAFCELFPNRSPMEHFTFLKDMKSLQPHYMEFKNLVRNFLIKCRKFSPKDPSLWVLEREEIQEIIEEKKQVPGLVHTIPEVGEILSNLAEFIGNFSLRKENS
jgi:hypothetical protein